MTDSRYSQVENNNNRRLDELSGKLSTFRNLNREIGSYAEADSSIVDQMNNSIGSLFSNVRNSSSRLTRAMLAGNSIWRMVCLSLLLFFIGYTLFKLF